MFNETYRDYRILKVLKIVRQKLPDGDFLEFQKVSLGLKGIPNRVAYRFVAFNAEGRALEFANQTPIHSCALVKEMADAMAKIDMSADLGECKVVNIDSPHLNILNSGTPIQPKERKRMKLGRQTPAHDFIDPENYLDSNAPLKNFEDYLPEWPEPVITPDMILPDEDELREKEARKKIDDFDFLN